MLLELKHVIKYVGDRRLLAIDNLKLAGGEKIGLVGSNGVGKTTLLGIMAGVVQPEEGKVTRTGDFSCIRQLEDGPDETAVSPQTAGAFGVNQAAAEHMSGGERTRYRIAAALDEAKPLLLADEPTANLDIAGRELLEDKLRAFKGALVLISHDRQLLDALCDAIWELEAGEVRVYPGNYSAYIEQKEIEQRRQEREYEDYTRAKQELEEAIIDRRARSAKTRKTPARMGNSEARLHKMGNQKAKANLDKAVKAMETRLEKLAVKSKPHRQPTVAFDFALAGDLYSKVVIQGEGIDKRFDRRVLFRAAKFSVYNGQKVALFGPNGCGKSTLLNMIVSREAPIEVSTKARIGYFRQGMEDLDLTKTMLDNVMATSVQTEGAVRNLLARLLFRREDVFKPAGVLSGGERTRVSLAKIMAGDANLLLLDEPTNYLDLSSLTALEEVLAEYRGTILFISHDRQFIDRLATQLLIVEDGQLRPFVGNYRQYHATQTAKCQAGSQAEKLVLDNRLTEIISRISVAKDKQEAARLEVEYRELLARMKE